MHACVRLCVHVSGCAGTGLAGRVLDRRSSLFNYFWTTMQRAVTYFNRRFTNKSRSPVPPGKRLRQGSGQCL